MPWRATSSGRGAECGKWRVSEENSVPGSWTHATYGSDVRLARGAVTFERNNEGCSASEVVRSFMEIRSLRKRCACFPFVFLLKHLRVRFSGRLTLQHRTQRIGWRLISATALAHDPRRAKVDGSISRRRATIASTALLSSLLATLRHARCHRRLHD